MPTATWKSRLRSGSAHWDLESGCAHWDLDCEEEAGVEAEDAEAEEENSSDKI